MIMITRTAFLCGTLVLPGIGTAQAASPAMVRSTVSKFAIVDDTQGDFLGVRTEHFDSLGRIIRWDDTTSDGLPETIWVALYTGDSVIPESAAYWSEDAALPYPEICVNAEDGSFQDVLFVNPGEKPRRQLRQYVDDAGRILYQEYFAPRSQRMYSEETYRYDAAGNELGRTWRRLDGKAQRDTQFQFITKDEYGAWTSRRVIIDGVAARIDQREIVYGNGELPLPSMISVTPTDRILPIPMARGVIATRAAGESSPSFSAAGDVMLFTRYTEDWTRQTLQVSQRIDGVWREPEALPFGDDLYNAAIRPDGKQLIFCKRDDGPSGGRVFVTSSEGDTWATPVDLTQRSGFTGSYFRLLDSGALYFHRDGDLYRCEIDDDGAPDGEMILNAPISTPDAVEFAPWTDATERVLLFTRSFDESPSRSGVFFSSRVDDSWGVPIRLPLPYGWSAVISPDGEDLVYVVDDDIRRVPLVLLPELQSALE